MKENTWANPEPARDEGDVEALAEVLREFMVYAGSPVRRRDLATRLTGEKMTPTQLRTVCEYEDARGRPETQTAAAIGFTLKTLNGWTEFLGDLEYAKKKQAARGGRTRGKGERGPVNLPPLDLHRRNRRELQSYVVERVTVDGKSREFVADQVGESVETIDRWLAEG